MAGRCGVKRDGEVCLRHVLLGRMGDVWGGET